jgi:hypothetical protein
MCASVAMQSQVRCGQEELTPAVEFRGPRQDALYFGFAEHPI